MEPSSDTLVTQCRALLVEWEGIVKRLEADIASDRAASLTQTVAIGECVALAIQACSQNLSDLLP